MKKILALLFMLFAATAYAIPPMPSGTPPVGTITGLFTGEGDYLKSDGTKGTPNGSGDVVGPAASTQYKIPLWGAADKTLVDGVAVGTEGMLLRSAGSGANPAWSAYTLALPGAVGAVLYSDGTNWTRSTAPSLLALTLYGQSAGGGAQLSLGSSSGSSDPNNGKMNFRNSTNGYLFTITSGVTGADIGWTLPTAAPVGANYLLNVDADGTMGYTDPSSLGSGITPGTAYQIYHTNSDASAGEWTSTLGATGTRLTKGWFTNLEVTNDITIGGAALATLYQPLDASLTALSGIAITVDGNNVTFPGGVITTAANGSRIVGTLDNTTTLTFLTAGTYGWYFDNGVPYFNINGTGNKSMYEGGSFGGLIFGDSSPGAAGEIGYDGDLKWYDTALRVAVAVDKTQTLTNKTFDANGTGNVLKGYSYIQIPGSAYKLYGSSVTAPSTTATAWLYNLPKFSNSADKANNYVDFMFAVPPDIDTAVDLTATLSIQLGGADTGDHAYILSMCNPAASAAAACTPGTPISLSYSADDTGADGDIEYTAETTLTDWKSNITAGRMIRVRLERDGDDGTNDTSTVDSYPLMLNIKYGYTN